MINPFKKFSLEEYVLLARGKNLEVDSEYVKNNTYITYDGGELGDRRITGISIAEPKTRKLICLEGEDGYYHRWRIQNWGK